VENPGMGLMAINPNRAYAKGINIRQHEGFGLLK
jgi:hypothetical protein